MPTNEPFYEHLPCTLDSQELVLKSRALAELLCDQSTIELEKKEANADFKSRLDAIDTKLSALALEVRTGKEYREVPCTEHADYADGRVEIIRMDTGQVVRMRPLEPHERQQGLAFAERGRAERVRRTERAINGEREPDPVVLSGPPANNDNADGGAAELDEFQEKLQ